jgi:hypothetical protein
MTVKYETIIARITQVLVRSLIDRSMQSAFAAMLGFEVFENHPVGSTYAKCWYWNRVSSKRMHGMSIYM